MNVALGSSELGRIFDLDEHDKVEVMPHIVLQLAVFLKRDRLVIERRPLETCNDTTAAFLSRMQQKRN